MPIEIRTPDDDDFPALFDADARAFGVHYAPAFHERMRPLMDVTRYRVAVEGAAIVGAAGSWSFDVTVPGGASVPMAGVTWVSVAATHRRQGLLRRLMAAIHDDVDDRGEPVAGLTASEGGIYRRFGYGVASLRRRVAIDTVRATLRAELVPKPGAVRFMEGDEARTHVAELWERCRRQQPGELTRSAAWWDFVLTEQADEQGGFTPVFHLRHDDGYAAYRVQMVWNNGRPASVLDVIELQAATGDAHLALWHTLLGVDLVASITSNRAMALDDHLPELLEDPRAVATEGLFDHLWLRPHDPVALLSARTYGTEDRLILEVAGDDAGSTARYEVEGDPAGGIGRRTRKRPDLLLDRASLGSIYLGGARPSVLARSRRITEARSGAVRRADAFFAAERLPHTQNPF